MAYKKLFESIKIGDNFNYGGLTYEVIRVGNTESRCKVITKTVHGTQRIRTIDNKIILSHLIK